MTTIIEMPEPDGMDVDDICYYTADQMREYAALARADEREACAKVCDELQSPPDWNLVAVLWKECRSKLAAAIRARGNT